MYAVNTEISRYCMRLRSVTPENTLGSLCADDKMKHASWL